MAKRRKLKKNHPVRKLLFIMCLVAIGLAEFIGITDFGRPDRCGNVDSGGEDSAITSEMIEGMSYSVVDSSPDKIPDFAGEDYIELNDNQPGFTEADFKNIKGETYSELDELGRCDTAVAMLDFSMMPTEERGQIGQIKPSGWKQAKYAGYVESNPPYLYNRCHLIAYALTGQNANEKNLITGTRYMNASTMLPFEMEVMEYLDHSENHVLYRVTPYFKDNELLARGVEMEAYSVEDEGEGVCFHVFVYNYQPGIALDYETGESWIKE